MWRELQEENTLHLMWCEWNDYILRCADKLHNQQWIHKSSLSTQPMCMLITLINCALWFKCIPLYMCLEWTQKNLWINLVNESCANRQIATASDSAAGACVQPPQVPALVFNPMAVRSSMFTLWAEGDERVTRRYDCNINKHQILTCIRDFSPLVRPNL